LAGHETTSVSLQYCLYNISRYPQYQTRLREEIFKQFPDDNLDYDTIKDFNIITNLVNETLRLVPPVNHLPGRETSEDTEIEGWFIPKGYQLMINVFQLHHDNKVWGDDVEEFNPDRFDNLTPLQKKSFIPFGGGSRICIGMSFSLLEQKLFLIKLLKKFELQWEPEQELEIEMGFMAPNPKKFYINFKKLGYD